MVPIPSSSRGWNHSPLSEPYSALDTPRLFQVEVTNWRLDPGPWLEPIITLPGSALLEGFQRWPKCRAQRKRWEFQERFSSRTRLGRGIACPRASARGQRIVAYLPNSG